MKVRKILGMYLNLSKHKKTPFISINYEVDEKDEKGLYKRLSQKLWVTPNTVKMTKGTLKKLGFEEDLKRFTKPDFNPMKYVNDDVVKKGLYLVIEQNEYQGKVYENVKYFKTTNPDLTGALDNVDTNLSDKEKASKDAKKLIENLPNRVKIKEDDDSDPQVDELPF